MTAERAPAPSRLALAAILLWIAALTAVFLMFQISPWWFELAAKKGLPLLLELRTAVLALFYRDYVF